MLHDQHIHVKVSIITVVRNAVDKIGSTLDSVLEQDYDNIEYIVIDGSSTDGTIDIIKRYVDKIAFFVSERDDGIYDALNKGIKQSTGAWIGVLNAGDNFASKDVVSSIFGDYNNYCGSDVIYGDAIGVDGKMEFYSKGTDDISNLLNGPAYRHGAAFVRSEVHKRYLFDLTKKMQLDFALDYEQIYRMYKSGIIFKKIAVPVVRYELRGVSTGSPFKTTYYNYLITHNMKCGVFMKSVLVVLTVWRGAIVVAKRCYERWKKCQ